MRNRLNYGLYLTCKQQQIFNLLTKAFSTWHSCILRHKQKQVIAWNGEDKRLTCSNLYTKPHAKPLNYINIWLCLWCKDRQTVCRSGNPTIITVFSTINYKKRESGKVRKRQGERWGWLYLGPVVPSPESWLPASLGVPADLAVGDKVPGAEGQFRQPFYKHANTEIMWPDCWQRWF